MRIQMSKGIVTTIFYLCSVVLCQDNLLRHILNNDKIYFDSLINNPKYDIKIIYTQINRNKDNEPSFKTNKLNADPKNYFYPASTVKLPACVFALEKINNLNIDGLNKFTFLRIDSSYKGQIAVKFDTTTLSHFPTIANYIKKILLVSDNDAFNRLYEFIGQKEFNEKLWEYGFTNSKINHRLSFNLSEKENRNTNKFTFFNNSGIIYEQPAKYSDIKYIFQLNNTKRGIGFYSGNNLIKQPKDFSELNYFSLEDQHEFIKRLFFHEGNQKLNFDLTFSDYDFLYKHMGIFPRECTEPIYDEKEYWDSYVKFFIYGDSKNKIPTHVRIFNKVGEAYGFLIDNAYIVDFENGVEFLLSAVIHVNKNGIYNDDKYEYEEIGFPFLARLGKTIYDFELKRPKKFLPDLSRLNSLFK